MQEGALLGWTPGGEGKGQLGQGEGVLKCKDREVLVALKGAVELSPK